MSEEPAAGLRRLGVGTAQFGLDYGVSNKGGRTPGEEAGRILSRAYEAGLRVIDTAADYGVSEETLGTAAKDWSGWRVVTKTARPGGAPQVEPSLRASLRRLRLGSVDGLLAHHAEDLLGAAGSGVYSELRRLKEQGLVRRIGSSVYTGDQIDALLSRYELDLVQVPFSVLDQRLISGGHLRRLKDRGIEIHARSVFLQGALLMAPQDLPPALAAARAHLERYRRRLAELRLSPVEAALGFALSIPEIDVAVCGMESLAQLEELVRAASRRADFQALAEFALDDARIVNPALWRR